MADAIEGYMDWITSVQGGFYHSTGCDCNIGLIDTATASATAAVVCAFIRMEIIKASRSILCQFQLVHK